MTLYEKFQQALSASAVKSPTYATECVKQLRKSMEETRSALGWPEDDFAWQEGRMRDDGHVPFSLKMKLHPAAQGSAIDVAFTHGEIWGDGHGQYWVKLGPDSTPMPQVHDPRSGPASHTIAGAVQNAVEHYIAREHPTQG
jgi:hypothetical protein